MSDASPRISARSSLQRRQAVAAGLFGILAGGSLYLAAGAHGDPVFFLFAGTMAAASGAVLWGRRRYRNLGTAVAEVNSAYVDLVAGRAAEAERKLDAIAPRASQQPYILRGLQLQRTMLAMRRGDMEAAAGWATRSLSFATTDAEGLQQIEARALRSLALASLGRGEEALVDARIVESSPMLGPGALARVSLARAVLLAQKGRAEELHAHYAAEGEALVEELGPRERMLSRALRRMGQPTARSVYREAAVLEEPGDEAARDWVRKIAPDAARFVPATAQGPLATDSVALDPPKASPAAAVAAGATAAPVRARKRRRSLGGRAVALWVVLTAAFFAIWTFLQPSTQESHHGTAASASTAWNPAATPLLFGILIFVVLMASYGWKRRRQRRQLRTIRQAQLALARGDDPQVIAQLDQVARAGGVALGPTADLVLAREAMRRGDTDAAIQACVDGLALGTSTLQARAAHEDILLPELAAMRAFALATAGRGAEATACLATLDRDHPRFPYRARAFFRVELINAVKRGDLAAAARIVAAREPEMSVELRVDLLGEVACAAAVGGLHDEAAIALQSELAAMPRVATWIEQAAPGLCSRIGRAHAVRVATPFVSRSDALREEDTVRLDEEAAQLIALGARRPRS